MSDTQRLASPSEQYFVLLRHEEMRMSHWVTHATLWEAIPERPLLALGNTQWSAEQLIWSQDSTCLTAELRRYPGDAPALQIAIYPAQRSVALHLPTGVATVPFDALEQHLESYYLQHTRTKSPTTTDP